MTDSRHGATTMSNCVVIIGKCTSCHATIVDDGISHKAVPSKNWLTANGHVYVYAPVKRSFWACDRCANNYAVDLCECGSGVKVNKCKCGKKTPIVTLGKPLPNALEKFAKCIEERRQRARKRLCQV